MSWVIVRLLLVLWAGGESRWSVVGVSSSFCFIIGIGTLGAAGVVMITLGDCAGLVGWLILTAWWSTLGVGSWLACVGMLPARIVWSRVRSLSLVVSSAKALEFCLMASVSLLVAAVITSAGVRVGVVIYLCLKNTVAEVLTALVSFIQILQLR